MKHLFEDWESIRGEIQRARNLLLFLDYDGTLTPIVARPELALCPPSVRRLLQRLRDLPGVYLAIISGRSLEDVRGKVAVAGITYVGNHGLEFENPAGKHVKALSLARKKELNRITLSLKRSLAEVPGVLFEEKGPILSLHYRNVPPKSIAQVSQIVEEELIKWKEGWNSRSGKMVFEIRPKVAIHKGKAVREIMKSYPFPGLLSIYLGDDQTDEDAFRTLKGQGISIFVGPGEEASEADFFLRDSDEVQDFLSRCLVARTKGC